MKKYSFCDTDHTGEPADEVKFQAEHPDGDDNSSIDLTSKNLPVS